MTDLEGKPVRARELSAKMTQRWLGNHGRNSRNSRVQGTRQNSTAQKVRERRRQEADRGLGSQTSQILLISVVHKGTVVFR